MVSSIKNYKKKQVSTIKKKFLADIYIVINNINRAYKTFYISTSDIRYIRCDIYRNIWAANTRVTSRRREIVLVVYFYHMCTEIFENSTFPDLKVIHQQVEDVDIYEMEYKPDYELVPLFIYDTNSPYRIKTFPILYKFDPKRPDLYKQYIQNLLIQYEKLPKKINGELRPKLNKKVLTCDYNELNTDFACYRTLYYNDRIAKSNRKYYESEEYNKIYPKEIHDHKRPVEYHYSIYMDKRHSFITASYKLDSVSIISKVSNVIMDAIKHDISRLHYEQVNKRFLLISMDVDGLPLIKSKKVDIPDPEEFSMNFSELDENEILHEIIK